jgi:hypothetical protein
MKENETLDQNITYVDEEILETLSYHVPAGGSLHLSLASFTNLKNTTITVEVEEGGHFEGAFADFSRSKYTFTLNVHLKGKASRAIGTSLRSGPKTTRNVMTLRSITKAQNRWA